MTICTGPTFIAGRLTIRFFVFVADRLSGRPSETLSGARNISGRSLNRLARMNCSFCSMTARKSTGFPVSSFLKVPTLIMTNTLRPSGKLALTSAQAGRSCPVLSGAAICSPHSVSCHITPAFGPVTSSNQLAKERLGSSASRAEAGIARTKDNARFSNESIWGAPIIQTHNTFVIANSFKFVMALAVELRPQLENAWVIRRGEARELARRYPRTAFDADIRKPQL